MRFIFYRKTSKQRSIFRGFFLVLLLYLFKSAFWSFIHFLSTDFHQNCHSFYLIRTGCGVRVVSCEYNVCAISRCKWCGFRNLKRSVIRIKVSNLQIVAKQRHNVFDEKSSLLSKAIRRWIHGKYITTRMSDKMCRCRIVKIAHTLNDVWF